MSTHIHSVCAAMLQHVNTLAGSGQSSQSEWGQHSLRICSILMNRSAASDPSCKRTSSHPQSQIKPSAPGPPSSRSHK